MIFRQIWTLVLTCFLCVVLVVGCQSEKPGSNNKVAPKKKVSKVAPVKMVETEAKSEQKEQPIYVYDPVGRRDPFVPLMEVKKVVPVDNGPMTPLQTFDVGQLRLSGIVVGHEAPIAMIMAPGGKSYLLKKGDKVGKNHGQVIDITQDGVFIKERFYDFSGVMRESVQEISLPKRSGVE